MAEINSFPIITKVFEELDVITDAQSTDADGVLLFDESVGVMKRMTRGELFKNKVIPIDSIAEFPSLDTDSFSGRQQFNLGSFAPGGEDGGGIMLWEPDQPKSLHDGVNYFSPTVPIPADFDNPTDVANYRAGVGEEWPAGDGIFVLNYFVSREEFESIEDGLAESEADILALESRVSTAESEIVVLENREADTVTTLATLSLPVGSKVSTKGCLSVGDGGHGTFIVTDVEPDIVDGYSGILMANGHWAVLQSVGGVIYGPQFGIVYDGVTDNSAALQRIATSASNMGCAVQLGSGEIFSSGDATEWQHPVTVTGMGTDKTVLIFGSRSGYAGIDGFTTTVDSGRRGTSVFANMTFKLVGDNGRHGISTPAGSAIFNTYLPKFVFSGLKFIGETEDPVKFGLFDYTWQRCLSVGDGLGHDINNCEFFGNYDYTLDPAGQNTTACAIYLSCAEDQGGMTMPKVDHCFTHYTGTPVFFGYRISNPTVSFSQFHRGYWGIYSPYPALGSNYGSDETYLYGLNINSQRCGVYSAGGGFFSCHGVRSTRAGGGFDHADGWVGFEFIDIIDLKMYDTRSYNAGTYSNPMVGYKFSECERITGHGFFHRGSLTKGIQIDEPEYIHMSGFQYENGTTAVGFEINRSVVTTSDVTLSGIKSGTAVTTPFVFSGTISRRNVRVTDGEDKYFGVDVSTTNITTAGTTTFTKVTNNQVLRYQLGTGAAPFTHNFQFSNTGANSGDSFILHLTQVATNPTATISDGTGAVQLTIAPTASTQRHRIELVHNGAQWRIVGATPSIA